MRDLLCVFKCIRRTFASMRVLNVAEKNEAAKNIAAILGRGQSNRVRFPILSYVFSAKVFQSLIKSMNFQ